MQNIELYSLYKYNRIKSKETSTNKNQHKSSNNNKGSKIREWAL